MGDIEIRHCRALIAVADRGGVGAAARALGLAQSTVSETLLSLERVIGAPVTLRRPGMEAGLAPAAEALLPLARRLVADAEAALAAVSGAGRTVVRLGAVESVASYLLPAVLAAFRARSPDVEVQVANGVCDDLRLRLGHGELDAALLLQAAGEPGARRVVAGGDIRRLTEMGLSLVAAPGDPLVGAEAPLAALAARGLLLPDPEGTLHQALRRWFGPSQSAAAFESAGSLDGLKRGVLARGAVGVLPGYAVAEDIAAGRLVELTPATPLPRVVLEIAVRTGATFPALANLLAEITAALGRPGPD